MAYNYDICTTEELGDTFSDYYKDVHGFRPRHLAFDDRAGLIQGLKDLDAYMQRMKETPEGRAELREQGWVVEEQI